MSRRRKIFKIFAALLLIYLHYCQAESPEIVRLWPSKPPGDENLTLPPEVDTSGPNSPKVANMPVIRLGNVSEPAIWIYHAPPSNRTDVAVMIAPGGGYNILAWDLEGTEVAKWLNSLGITAIVLKYRVPKRSISEPWLAPLQDGQRAMGLIRKHALRWQINPTKIGVLGFSAGAHLCAMLSNSWDARRYPIIDQADHYLSRPDFSVLIYPAYLTADKQNLELAHPLKVCAQSPPAISIMSLDDPIGPENAIAYTLALHKAGVPAELHIYHKGGHGYGLRSTGYPVSRWPIIVESWLKQEGWLEN